MKCVSYSISIYNLMQTVFLDIDSQFRPFPDHMRSFPGKFNRSLPVVHFLSIFDYLRSFTAISGRFSTFSGRFSVAFDLFRSFPDYIRLFSGQFPSISGHLPLISGRYLAISVRFSTFSSFRHYRSYTIFGMHFLL